MIKILFSTGQFLVNACKQDWYSLILQLGKKNMQMDRNTSTEGKDTINNWIIPFLSVGKRGFKSNFDMERTSN